MAKQFNPSEYRKEYAKKLVKQKQREEIRESVKKEILNIPTKQERIERKQQAIAERKQQRKKLKKPIDVYNLTEKVRRDYEKQKEYERNKKIIAFEERQARYKKTRTGRFAGVLTKGLKKTMQRGGITRALYRRSIQPKLYKSTYYEGGKSAKKTVPGRVSIGRGRPAGTYDKRYTSYGGVYGYRKMLNAQIRQQKLEAYRRATITPQQQGVINQMQRQEAYRRSNPEGHIIPDTYGQVPMNDIFRDINNAVNLFD